MDNILLLIIIVIIVGVIVIASPFVNTLRTLSTYQNHRLRVAIQTVALILLISLGIYGYLTGEPGWLLGLLMGTLFAVLPFVLAREEKKRNLKKGKKD